MSPPAPEPNPRSSDGERFLELYSRYRHVVREELEAAGVTGESAERLVGTVFERLSAVVQAETQPDPVVTVIRSLAREVSKAPAERAAPSGHFPVIGDTRVSGG